MKINRRSKHDEQPSAADARPVPAWRAPAHERLGKALDLPMLILSIGFLVVLIWPTADPHMSSRTRSDLTAADWFIWAAFAAEYGA